MENNNAPLLEMRSIKKDFFGNQVLTDISFTLREGEVLGLVGENGAGKSTPTFETGYVVRNGDIVGITIVTAETE